MSENINEILIICEDGINMFRKNNMTGSFTLDVNFFKGGITNFLINKRESKVLDKKKHLDK